MLRVQPSGIRTYYVQVSRGKRIRIGPAGTYTLAHAEETAKRILLSPQGDAAFTKNPKVRLDHYIEQSYLPYALARLKNGAQSVARVRSVWEQILPRRVDEIGLTEIERIRDQRLNLGVAPATVNRDVAALSGVLAHWAKSAKGAVHPLQGLRKLAVPEDENVRYLTPEERLRLLAALERRDTRIIEARNSANLWREERGYQTWAPIQGYGDHLTPMVILSLNTGLRQGELFSLAWTSVDLKTRTLTVLASHSKGNRTRSIPLNDAALQTLVAIQPHSASGLVFKSPKTGGAFDNVKKAWGQLIKEAEIPGLRWHDMRHDFASSLVMRGVSLYAVQQLLGHTTAAMTQRYAKLAPSALAQAVGVLDVASTAHPT